MKPVPLIVESFVLPFECYCGSRLKVQCVYTSRTNELIPAFDCTGEAYCCAGTDEAGFTDDLAKARVPITLVQDLKDGDMMPAADGIEDWVSAWKADPVRWRRDMDKANEEQFLAEMEPKWAEQKKLGWSPL